LLEIGDCGASAYVEGLLADAFVASLRPSDVVEAGQGVLDRRPLTKDRPPGGVAHGRLVMAKGAWPDRFRDIAVHEWALDFYQRTYRIDRAQAASLRRAQWLDWTVDAGF
jgi:hypothetical protein